MTEDTRPVLVNRELSWLKFNERVLEEAEKESNPLCERLSFASIYQSNMDEFFMVRVGSLIDQMLISPMAADSKTNMTPKEQIDAITKKVKEILPRRDKVYKKLMAEVENQGVRLVDFHAIGKEESEKLEQYFDKEIMPLIAPNVVGKKQPFPFLNNKEIYAAAVLVNDKGKERLGIIPCQSGVFPRLIDVDHGSGVYMLAEELILHFLPKVFKNYTVTAKTLIRITRNADMDADSLYDDDLDYREFMAELIKKRKKLEPVRLELSREMDDKIIDVLCTYLKLERSQVFRYQEPLDLSFLFRIEDILRQKSELFYKKRVPQKSRQIDSKRSMLEQIRERDLFLSYPYNSINPFLTMLHEAAVDENVLSIKMTLYRVAKQSKVVEALIEAAENGKEVLVLVELKARFDEENNIQWSRQLEAAGCRVIYGIPGYKVHSKLCLITRRENSKTEYFTQVGTGNYNEKTARIYTDLCLMTANPAIGTEAAHVFQNLIRGEVVEHTDYLLVAPKCLQNKILEMIDEQISLTKAGGKGYIGVKVNSLSDKKICAKLIEASKAGVKIEMVIRGICCLLPGIPGVTDNIRIISIVGRYLEHSRIYIFGRPEQEDPRAEKIYIASADYMTRNTVRRVEVAAPILDPELKKTVREFFQTQMNDNVQARELLSTGHYVPVRSDKETLNSQEFFFEQAYASVGEKLPEIIEIEEAEKAQKMGNEAEEPSVIQPDHAGAAEVVD